MSSSALSQQGTTVLRLHPQVSVRPEPFGALLYHFGNRKLTFIKDPTLFSLVDCLGEGTSVDEALDAHQIAPGDRDIILRSLDALVRSDMLQEVNP
jgi:putative mycofactocin binding protein MftB